MSDIRKLVAMVDEIHRMENKWGFKLGFYGRKVTSSLIWKAYQNPTGVRKVREDLLKGLLTRIHELWIWVHIIEAILDNLGGQLNSSYVKVRGYPEEPAVIILGTHYGDITIWYQFYRYGPGRHGKLLQMCMQRQYNQVAQILGLSRSPQDCSQCYSVVNQGNLIPDIVLVKGNFKRANDIRDSTQTRVIRKAIIIDPKLELKDKDCNQLNSYLSIFPIGSTFICPCMCPCNEKALDYIPNNWMVITCVEPFRKGLSLRTVINRNYLKNIKCNKDGSGKVIGQGIDDFKKCLIDSIKNFNI